MRVCVCACVCVCVCLYVYVHVYVCIYTYARISQHGTYQLHGPYNDHHWPMTRLCLHLPTPWSVQWLLTTDHWPGCVWNNNFMVCQMTTTDQWPGYVCTYQLHGLCNDHHWPMTNEQAVFEILTSWSVKWPSLTNDQAVFTLTNFIVRTMTTDQWPGYVCTCHPHGLCNDHHWPMTRLCLHLPPSWSVQWPPLTTDQWPGCGCTHQFNGLCNDHWPMTRLCLPLPTSWSVQWLPLTTDHWPGYVCTYQLHGLCNDHHWLLTKDQAVFEILTSWAVFALTNSMVCAMTTDQWLSCVCTHQLHGLCNDHWPMTKLCLHSPTSWSVHWPLTND